MAIITGLIAGGLALAAGASATVALAAAGVGLAAGGAYQASQARKQQAAFSRDMALTNEVIALDNARDVELRGRQAVYDQRRAVARQLSSVRAASAGAGMVVDEIGTVPQDMVIAMAEAGELDVMRLQNNIERERRRALVQGAQFEAQAGQFELQRSSESPFRSALVTGVSGAVGNYDLLFGG